MPTENLNLSDYPHGIRVKVGSAHYHLSASLNSMFVRLVDVDSELTTNLLLHMPASNLVEITPTRR